MTRPTPTMSTTEAAPNPVEFKKPALFKKGPRSRPNQSRKRSASPSAEDQSAAEATIVRPTKKSILNPLVQGTKRRRTGQGEDEEAGGLDEFDYKADEGAITRADQLATRDNNWDLESLEKKEGVKVNEDGEIVPARDDGLYRGQKGYLPTINKRPDSMDKKMSASAPIRATANIRTITVMDYQPDVCTPYQKTGYCGYGDSCKFMHDRSDYLAGWQLDKLDPNDNAVQEIEEEEEMLPFACLLCEKEFTDPIITKCGHYFCMQCAIDRFIKSPKCYACGAATNGIFNKAEKIIAKLKAKQERRQEERAERLGEAAPDDGIEIGGCDGGSDDE